MCQPHAGEAAGSQDMASMVQSHLCVHTQTSIRVFAESLFSQAISFPTGFTMQLPKVFELQRFKQGRFRRPVSEVGLKPTAKSFHQKSQQLLNTPSKLLLRTWLAVGPFSCPQVLDVLQPGAFVPLGLPVGPGMLCPGPSQFFLTLA